MESFSLDSVSVNRSCIKCNYGCIVDWVKQARRNADLCSWSWILVSTVGPGCVYVFR